MKSSTDLQKVLFRHTGRDRKGPFPGRETDLRAEGLLIQDAALKDNRFRNNILELILRNIKEIDAVEVVVGALAYRNGTGNIVDAQLDGSMKDVALEQFLQGKPGVFPGTHGILFIHGPLNVDPGHGGLHRRNSRRISGESS